MKHVEPAKNLKLPPPGCVHILSVIWADVEVARHMVAGRFVEALLDIEP